MRCGQFWQLEKRLDTAVSAAGSIESAPAKWAAAAAQPWLASEAAAGGRDVAPLRSAFASASSFGYAVFVGRRRRASSCGLSPEMWSADIRRPR